MMTDVEIASCKALGRAVLMDALKGLDKKRHKKVDYQTRAEIVKWFKSNADDWLFAFVPLCKWLGLDPSAVRRELKQKGKV